MQPFNKLVIYSDMVTIVINMAAIKKARNRSAIEQQTAMRLK